MRKGTKKAQQIESANKKIQTHPHHQLTPRTYTPGYSPTSDAHPEGQRTP